MGKVLIGALCFVALLFALPEFFAFGTGYERPERVFELTQEDFAKMEFTEELNAIEEKQIFEQIEEKQEAYQLNEEKRKREEKTNKIQTKNFEKNRTMTFEITFYTTLPEHNGGYSNMANGQPIDSASWVVASNVYSFGTKIHLEGMGTYTVADRGGSAFNQPHRLDVLVPRKEGESRQAYIDRVWSYGRKKIVGTVLN